MFGIGGMELLVIFLVALIVLGPKSLVDISRTLGKVMGEFRRVSTDFQRTLNTEAAREDENQRKKETASAAPDDDAPPQSPASSPTIPTPLDRAVAKAEAESAAGESTPPEAKA
jgi:sec-independent protein translocase protein TatB